LACWTLSLYGASRTHKLKQCEPTDGEWRRFGDPGWFFGHHHVIIILLLLQPPLLLLQPLL
jgi:hypothetical protein